MGRGNCKGRGWQFLPLESANYPHSLCNLTTSKPPPTASLSDIGHSRPWLRERIFLLRSHKQICLVFFYLILSMWSGSAALFIICHIRCASIAYCVNVLVQGNSPAAAIHLSFSRVHLSILCAHTLKRSTIACIAFLPLGSIGQRVKGKKRVTAFLVDVGAYC